MRARLRGPRLRIASAIAACVHLAALPWAPWASARPARMWARNSCGRRRPRRLGERAADVDSGVVVGAADGGAAVGLDVDERRQVELLGARAVAGLPDREQLRQAAAVARGQRRLDGVERVRQRGGDLVLVQILGARLDVVAVGLQPLVIVGRDPVAEDVHGLGLALEPRGQLLGDERVGQVGDRQRARRSCRGR